MVRCPLSAGILCKRSHLTSGSGETGGRGDLTVDELLPSLHTLISIFSSLFYYVLLAMVKSLLTIGIDSQYIDNHILTSSWSFQTFEDFKSTIAKQ